MAGMEDMEKVKEKEEELPTPPSDVTDRVEDDANDMAVVHQNKAEAEAQETETMKAAPVGVEMVAGFGFGMMLHAQAGTESEAGVQEESSEKTMRNELEMGIGAQAEEDGERKSACGEMRERNETIEFEVKYVDNGEKEIELVLDLDKFNRYAPHCHNCNHLATKLILRRKITDPNPNPNPNQKKKYWFVIWFEFFVALIWGKPDPTPPNQFHQPADSGKSVNKGTRNKGGEKVLFPSTKKPDKNGNEPKRDTGKIEDKIKHKEEDGKGKLPSTDQPNKNEHEPYGDIGKDENDGKHKKEGGKGKHPSTHKPDKNENEELRKKKKKEKKQKTGRSKSESSDSGSDTDDEEEEEVKRKIVDFFINLRAHLNIVEILKCIVYGGLIESITSLSVVASGAATDASTLNVFAIGLALLFSGLIAIGSKLADLKRGRNKHYKELLGGSKDEFVFHSTLVILSYLVFGLVAPSTFAFTFVDKYAKILAAAAAGFACIFILAIAKVYTSKDKHVIRSYVETARNYLIVSFFTSGIAYVVGYSIEMYVLKFGLFTSVERVTCYHGEAY